MREVGRCDEDRAPCPRRFPDDFNSVGYMREVGGRAVAPGGTDIPVQRAAQQREHGHRPACGVVEPYGGQLNRVFTDVVELVCERVIGQGRIGSQYLGEFIY